MKNSIAYTKANLEALQIQLDEMINKRIDLIKHYQNHPSESLQNTIINIGKEIGTANSVINEIKLFGKA